MRFAQKMETCRSNPGSAAYLSPNGFKEGDYAKRGGFEIMREFSRLKHVGATRETNSQPRKYDRRFAEMVATSRLSDVLTGDGEMALHTALSQMTYLTRGRHNRHHLHSNRRISPKAASCCDNQALLAGAILTSREKRPDAE